MKFWGKKAPAKPEPLPPPDLADPKWDAVAAYFVPGRQFTHLGAHHVVIRLTHPWAHRGRDYSGPGCFLPASWSVCGGIVTTEYPSYLSGLPPESRQWSAHEYDYLLSRIPKGEPHA